MPSPAPSLFVGSYRHALDDKRRVAIPKALRDAIVPARDGEAFYLTRAVEPCLWLFTETEFGRVSGRIDALRQVQGGGIGSKDLRAFQRTLFGLARRCEPDAQGRIVLPEDLCARARIDREVEFLGVGDRVELWAPEQVPGRGGEDEGDFERTARELFG